MANLVAINLDFARGCFLDIVLERGRKYDWARFLNGCEDRPLKPLFLTAFSYTIVGRVERR